MAVYRNPTSEITRSPTTQFRTDVLKGLTALPKFLQSKYFYDADGDKLFRQIMNCPEYYLTDCELEIFSQQTVDLGNTFLNNYHDFDIIELGPGDASKSTWLLKYLVKLGFDFTYFPIDISKSVTDYLEKELPERILGLEINVLNGEYIEMIKLANKLSTKQKIVLFLGGNIGNFSPNDVVSFLFTLRENLSPGDLMLIGVDSGHVDPAFRDDDPPAKQAIRVRAVSGFKNTKGY